MVAQPANSVMQALGAEPDIYEKLTASLAPSIWQMEDVKKGVLCQLFGGTTKVSLGAGKMRSGQTSLSLPACLPSNLRGQLCRDGYCGQSTARAGCLTALWSQWSAAWWLGELQYFCANLACTMTCPSAAVALCVRTADSQTVSAAGHVQ